MLGDQPSRYVMMVQRLPLFRADDLRGLSLANLALGVGSQRMRRIGRTLLAGSARTYRLQAAISLRRFSKRSPLR